MVFMALSTMFMVVRWYIGLRWSRCFAGVVVYADIGTLLVSWYMLVFSALLVVVYAGLGTLLVLGAAVPGGSLVEVYGGHR